MGIAEQRDAVRIERYHLFSGSFDGLHALVRQAVQHVEIDRVDAATAHGLNHFAGLLEGLFAIDRLLNPGHRNPGRPD